MLLIFHCKRMTKNIQKLENYSIISEKDPEAKRTSYMSGNVANKPYDGHTIKFLVGLISSLHLSRGPLRICMKLCSRLCLYLPHLLRACMFCPKCPFICVQSFYLASPLSPWLTSLALLSPPTPPTPQITRSLVRCTVSCEASHGLPQRPHLGPDHVPSSCAEHPSEFHSLSISSDSVIALLCATLLCFLLPGPIPFWWPW